MFDNEEGELAIWILKSPSSSDTNRQPGRIIQSPSPEANRVTSNLMSKHGHEKQGIREGTATKANDDCNPPGVEQRLLTAID
jgi:hypothetical protein